MGLMVTVGPTAEPITLAEAKLHLRYDLSTEDDAISECIQAAREEAEQLTGRAIGEQTMVLKLDHFPAEILLERPPLISVDSVQYLDAAGALQTIDNGDYSVDERNTESWIVPAYGFYWPATYPAANAVTVTFRGGYETCPALIKRWMYTRIGVLFEVRESASERPAIDMPWVERLLDRYRIWTA